MVDTVALLIVCERHTGGSQYFHHHQCFIYRTGSGAEGVGLASEITYTKNVFALFKIV
jgi:hypothetical protein